MNAIVGLSDLTSMMDDVPEQVRENLGKIRSLIPVSAEINQRYPGYEPY